MNRPLTDYALLGDTRSAALVSSSGSIDWWCLPRFDGEPICGRLLGGPEAGYLSLGPAGEATLLERDYLPGAPVLRTSWRTASARLTLTEGMVCSVQGRLLPATLLVRRIEAVGGSARVRLAVQPRRGARRERPQLRPLPGGVRASWGPLAVAVHATPHLVLDKRGMVEVDVHAGQPLTVAVSAAWREPLVHVPPHLAWAELLADAQRWRGWTHELPSDVPFAAAVERSLLVLRLLTYSPSGAPVAAVTTSLPEELGGVRNWDYRFTWPRDASIGVAAFLGLGKQLEARMFLRWLLHASRLDRPRLPPMLTLDGRRVPPERQLDGWPGYRDSRPVRVGNDARDQHQLDGYGWLIDAVSVFTAGGHALDGETWRATAGFADYVARRWREPDAGIWEERQPPQHHTHSKIMGWLALDRALRIADTRRVRQARRHRWRTQRDAIAADIRAHGFNTTLGAYTRTYHSSDLDAALLILPLIGIEPPGSPRITGTIDAIRRELAAGGPYLYRYRPGKDGLPGTEGAFLPCSFWLVQALAHLGRLDEARQLMHKLLDAAPLGLFSEEADPTTGELLGNYPQAFTHATLLQATLALRDTATRDKPSP